MIQLTAGSIQALYNEDKNSPLHNNPTVQVINIKTVNVQGGARHRVIVSDGVHFMQAMLAAQHSALVDEGKIKRHSIITLNEFVCNALQNRKILIILNFDVVQVDYDSKIGTPVTYESNLGSAQNNSSAAAVTNPVPKQEPQQPSYNQNNNFSSGNGANMQLEANLTPIRNLNPYQTRWHIKARVTQKSPIRKWHNARGDGQLFSVNLLDQSGEIKATAFNDQVDRLYNMLEEGRVYYISKARVTMAKKQFSTLNNEYELSLDPSTEFEACSEGTNIPQMNFEFVKIADLEKHEKGANVDVIGIVNSDLGISEIVSKATGKPTKKREISIVDDSFKSVRLTLWDIQAEQFDSSNNPIIACKGCRVNDFGGRSLSLSSSGSLKVNLEIPEAQKLRKWYNEKGQSSQFESFNAGMVGFSEGGPSTISNRKITLAQAKAENLGMGDRADYFSFRGTIVYIKNENFSYPSCPECKKKVLMESEHVWRCEKCQKNYPEPDHRYILSVSVEDATSQIYISGFDEMGSTLLKMSANELNKLRDQDATAAQLVFSKALFTTYNFKIKAKQETFNDLTRIKYNCIEVTPIDFVKESREMADAIEKLLI